MEIQINPANLIGWFGLLGGVVAAITFTIYQVRSSDLKLLRTSNKDLRDALGDLTLRVESLEEENNRLKGDLANKVSDYDNLKFKKNYLKQIIIESLSKRKDMTETLMNEMLDGKKR